MRARAMIVALVDSSWLFRQGGGASHNRSIRYKLGIHFAFFCRYRNSIVLWFVAYRNSRDRASCFYHISYRSIAMSSEKEGMYSTPEAATALASNFSLEDSEVSSTHQRRIVREKQAAAEQELEVLFLERSIREAKLQNLRPQLEESGWQRL